MGYFSNGTEGEGYQARYCARCVHDTDDGCAVWAAHLWRNGDQHRNVGVEIVLGTLIPRTPDGLGNEQCRMFLEKQP